MSDVRYNRLGSGSSCTSEERDVTNEKFTGVAGEVRKDIHCFSPISCLTSAILSRPCSMSLRVERVREKEVGEMEANMEL